MDKNVLIFEHTILRESLISILSESLTSIWVSPPLLCDAEVSRKLVVSIHTFFCLDAITFTLPPDVGLLLTFHTLISFFLDLLHCCVFLWDLVPYGCAAFHCALWILSLLSFSFLA